MTRQDLLRAAALSVIGALLLGAAAALLSLRHYPRYEATLQLRITPDPVVGAPSSVEDVDPDTFLASELVILNGPALRSELSEALPASVAVSARTQQVGRTSLVVVAANADTPDAARTGADLVAARYAGNRRDALLAQVQAVSAQVQRQLATTSTRIEELAELGGVTSDVQRAALTAEYSRLVEQQNALRVAEQSSNRLVTVVKPVDLGGVPQVVNPARDFLFWGGLGGALGLAAAVGLARWRRRVSGLDDLLELAPELALPTLPQLRGDELVTRASLSAAAHVSALTPAGGGFGEPALVVLAPHPGAGSTYTAVALAVASGRRGPTLLMAAGDAVDGEAARLLELDEDALARAEPGVPVATSHPGLMYLPVTRGRGVEALEDLETQITDGLLASVVRSGVAVVVDAPPLSESSAALDLAREAGSALLVGGVDHTRAAELDAAATALRRVGAVLVGVVLSTPRRPRRRWRSEP